MLSKCAFVISSKNPTLSIYPLIIDFWMGNLSNVVYFTNLSHRTEQIDIVVSYEWELNRSRNRLKWNVVCCFINGQARNRKIVFWCEFHWLLNNGKICYQIQKFKWPLNYKMISFMIDDWMKMFYYLRKVNIFIKYECHWMWIETRRISTSKHENSIHKNLYFYNKNRIKLVNLFPKKKQLCYLFLTQIRQK